MVRKILRNAAVQIEAVDFSFHLVRSMIACKFKKSSYGKIGLKNDRKLPHNFFWLFIRRLSKCVFHTLRKKIN